MKVELEVTFKTHKKALNFIIFPTVWYYDDTKDRPKYRIITFAWMWWQLSFLLDVPHERP